MPPRDAPAAGFLQKLYDQVLEDTSTSGTKFSTLDGLRGIAVLTVFFSHSSGFRQRLTPWTSFHGTGHLGVYLFFVLSGFLLTWSLLAAPRVDFTGFYIRRFFRIAPLYYLVVTGVWIAQLCVRQVDLFNLHIKNGSAGYVQHLLFYRGDSVFWTIAAEFEFYLILPFLVLALRCSGRRAAAVLGLTAVACAFWYLLIELGRIDPRHAIKVASIAHHSQFFDVFLAGILAAWLYRSPRFATGEDKHRKWLHRIASLAALALIVISLGLVSESFFGAGRLWRNAQPWWQALGVPAKFGPADFSLFFGAGFALIALAALTGHRFFTCVGNWRPIRVIGVTGFSWYLVHFPILRLVNRLFGFAPTAGGAVVWTWREPLALATSFLLATCAAILLYLAVEKPFMLFSRALLRRRTVTPA
jgi:peptidoglycan/LPS O-acetylase OafA/YrhL